MKSFYGIVICILLLILILLIQKNYLYSSNICSKINLDYQNQIETILENIMQKKNTTRIDTDKWYLTIPKINLNQAYIQEGTDENTLNQAIGHFENTAFFYGNVGLASHNRGNASYFSRINQLEIGDEISYHYCLEEKTYQVNMKAIIDVYDWSYLENSSHENKITLITCIENDSNKRLCIQAIERRNN